MHGKTYAWGFTASLVATVAWFAGCGGTVAQVTSSGSGGQTTTATVTTGSTSSSSSSSSSTSTTSSSSSGTTTGTSPCDMACAHIQMCTGFTCQQANIDCSTVGTQFDCVANCAAAVPCSQLGIGTLQMCQAMCAADGGAGDGGATDAGVSACGQCEVQSCGQAAATSGCLQDTTCQGWLQCVAGCNQAAQPDSACFTACDTMYASAQAEFDPIYACACSKCSSECASADPCSHGADGGP